MNAICRFEPTNENAVCDEAHCAAVRDADGGDEPIGGSGMVDPVTIEIDPEEPEYGPRI